MNYSDLEGTNSIIGFTEKEQPKPCGNASTEYRYHSITALLHTILDYSVLQDISPETNVELIYWDLDWSWNKDKKQILKSHITGSQTIKIRVSNDTSHGQLK
jgi:hypothetical protein